MNKPSIDIDAQERQMLELLARGESSREIAGHMGYREGTMRVYLHELYRKLGVANKTNAVIWYLDRTREGGTVAARVGSDPGPGAEEGFGEFARRTSLGAALGVMAIFIGGHGRLWEVGQRLKGIAPDAAADARRRESRRIWEALLAADFAVAKAMLDSGRAEIVLGDSPSDGVAIATMLVIGGYTGRAEKFLQQVARRRKAGHGATAKEFAFLKLLLGAFEKRNDEALAGVHHLATETGPASALKHLALVSLFHAWEMRGDTGRANAAARAIWLEAESMRGQLEAMGERPLGRDAPNAAPAKGGRERVRAALEALKAPRTA
jgi:DNA-binding CsgD family transcriptional regulator